MNEILQQFEKMRIVPVVAIQNAEDSMQLADALIEGGLPCAEITFRTTAAIDAMRIMAKRNDLLVGAGTVLKVDQVKAAVDVGARFMVSPGFNPKVVGYCVENNIPVTPGICTPSDIEAALEFRLEALKFFPAEAFGGLKTLKAMSGPYTTVKFVPTGGVNPNNLLEYLKSALISEGKFDEIMNNAREAVEIVNKLKPSA
jgi:2-dehydro-3-deoxyphosphogluconate aldolase/(4S)-4-hydroxy-2-oxoglutarate aldolase